MKFTKIVKADQNEKLDTYTEYAYAQLEDIKKGIEHAKQTGNLDIKTLKDISHHLSNARILINYFIVK